MNSLEESVGGNDRDCPCEMSFPHIYVCARMLVKRMRAWVCVFMKVKNTEEEMKTDVKVEKKEICICMGG